MLLVVLSALFLNAQADEPPTSVTCHSMAMGVVRAMELGPDGQGGSEYRLAALSLSEALRIYGWSASAIEHEVHVRQSGYALIARFVDGWDNEALAVEAVDYSERTSALFEANPEQENLFRLMFRDGWRACAEREATDSGWANLLGLARQSLN